MVDANMRWSADQAIRAARAFAEHDVYWLEEPTIPDDVPGHARIVREGGLPVAAGENLHSLYEFQALIDGRRRDFPEPDLSNCGGVSVWLKVARIAEAANLPVTSHGVHDLHVHLLAAVPNASYLEVHGFGLERFMAEPLAIRDGKATAPERPATASSWTGGRWRRCARDRRHAAPASPVTAARASGRQARDGVRVAIHAERIERCCLPGLPCLSQINAARAEAVDDRVTDGGRRAAGASPFDRTPRRPTYGSRPDRAACSGPAGRPGPRARTGVGARPPGDAQAQSASRPRGGNGRRPSEGENPRPTKTCWSTSTTPGPVRCACRRGG